jgi:hypothetical protein
MSAADLLRRLSERRAAAVTGVRPSAVAPVAPVAPSAGNAALERLRAAKKSPTVESEGRRIGALPTWQESDFDGLDLTDEFRTATGTERLRPRQSLALHWLRATGGLVGPLAVGSGKTLITLLAAQAVNARRPLLLIPPAMRIPLQREIDKKEPHWKIPKNLMVVPYSQLSVARGSDLLVDLRPDLIVADEAHLLRHPDSARTRRLLRFFRQYPTTKFVAVSGTLTAKSLRDYAHLCELALHDGSPLPREARDLIAWANCIDARGIAREQDWAVLSECFDVRDLEPESRREAAREAFRGRLTRTRGVVATTEPSVGCSLILYRRADPVLPPVVSDALRTLRATWCRPDGEELQTPLDMWRIGVQMSQGFYYRWDWPGGIVDGEWMALRAAWHRAVRGYLALDLPGYDSPLLVTNGVLHGKITDPSLISAWQAWDRVRHRPQPPTVTVWLDDYLLRDAAEWRRAHPEGIVWYADKAIGEALRQRGERVFWAGETPPYDGRALALSISAHGTGLNLQPWSENLVLSWPSSGKTCEQLIGRTHRQGQEADEVGVWYYGHTPEARALMRKSIEEARYIQHTTGSPQKMIYAAFVGDVSEPPLGG